MNKHRVLGTSAVNREGEAFGEQTVILAEEDAVDARVKVQRIDVGKQSVEEVCSEARTLFFLEFPSLVQIPLDGVEDENPHAWPVRRFLAASQSENTAFPEAT